MFQTILSKLVAGRVKLFVFGAVLFAIYLGFQALSDFASSLKSDYIEQGRNEQKQIYQQQRAEELRQYKSQIEQLKDKELKERDEYWKKHFDREIEAALKKQKRELQVTESREVIENALESSDCTTIPDDVVSLYNDLANTATSEGSQGVQEAPVDKRQ